MRLDHRGILCDAFCGQLRKDFFQITESGKHARNETCLMPFNQVITFFSAWLLCRQDTDYFALKKRTCRKIKKPSSNPQAFWQGLVVTQYLFFL